jgi:murein DD-endopeptidase MepM/ murein hydrolase activator NlpD
MRRVSFDFQELSGGERSADGVRACPDSIVLGRRARALLGALALVGLLGALIPPPPAYARICLPSSNFAVAGGWFFSETGSDTDLGYVVSDDEQARFWEAFQDEGGVSALGFPVSQRFQFRGFTTQAFQKAILQWDPARDGVNYFNTLDELNSLGLDDFLFNFRQIPLHAALPADVGLDPRDPGQFQQIERNHLALLDPYPLFREVFDGDDWRELYGLPIAFQDFGPFQAVRTQRQVLQVFTVEGLGGAVGVVSAANSGDIAKEAGLIPEFAAAPTVAPIDLTETPEGLILDAANVSPGGAAIIRVSGVAGVLSVAYAGLNLTGFCVGGADTLLIPIDRSTPPGPVPIAVNVADGGSARVLSTEFTVEQSQFGLSIIHVPDDLVSMLDPAVIAAEDATLTAIYGNVTARRIWNGRFLWPVLGPITTPFGDDRIYEPGSVPGFHSGLDIAASEGTAVAAAQNGVVVWAGTLPIRGNTVILDHGWGIFTGYSHLSAINVQTGGQVFAGQTMGLIGNTGRWVGAHLHLEFRVHNVPLDPVPWLDTDLLGG